MSRVMPYTQVDVRDWASRTPEPFDLSIPGWDRDEPKDGLLPNERAIVLTSGTRAIYVFRHWDRPLTPGQPLDRAGRRTVEIQGRRYEIATTVTGDLLTWFRPEKWCGYANCVEMPKPHERWFGRIVAAHCEPADVELALGHLVFTETRRYPPHSCEPKFVIT